MNDGKKYTQQQLWKILETDHLWYRRLARGCCRWGLRLLGYSVLACCVVGPMLAYGWRFVGLWGLWTLGIALIVSPALSPDDRADLWHGAVFFGYLGAVNQCLGNIHF